MASLIGSTSIRVFSSNSYIESYEILERHGLYTYEHHDILLVEPQVYVGMAPPPRLKLLTWSDHELFTLSTHLFNLSTLIL